MVFSRCCRFCFEISIENEVAGVTGLEPAASGALAREREYQ